ncbi:MAG: alkanesulfonate monooxygenase SsuD [Gammaproteobacteria bacterium]|jgi:alkanesulfonate monooxygenase SsuD/methylene tetrahydromethanopterin reductase-like flavin-dependent oxidoreductase (luciferase family)
MTIEFGIFDHLDMRAGETLAQTYTERLRFIQAAEEGGFRNYHLAEHHGTPLGSAPSPNVFLAAVATHTSRIKIGPLVYVVPAYLPMRLLEEICMLDNLSNGRLEFGMGRGISPIEIKYCGLNPEDTIDLLAEAEEIIALGLISETLTYQGKYYHYDKVPMTLRPLQNPVPMWSAAKSPEGQDMSSRRGMHSVSLGATATVKALTASYLEYWDKNRAERQASAPETPYLGAYRLIYVNDDEVKAREIGERAFDDWRTKLEKLWKENDLSVPFLTVLGSFEVANDCGMMVCGTSAQVTEKLKQQVVETGINYFALQIAFGDLGHVEEMRSLKLVTSKIMPAFKII